MLEKVKQNLIYLVSAAMGLLFFLFNLIPCIGVSVYGRSHGFNGYTVLADFWKAGAVGVLMALAQVIELILAIVLLIIGVIGVLRMFGIVNTVPPKNITIFAMVCFMNATALSMLFAIIYAAVTPYWVPFAGVFIMFVFAVAAFVVQFFVAPLVSAYAGGCSYVCNRCGAKSHPKITYCGACGGTIVKVLPAVYACEQCGTEAAKGTAFCVKCGGKIVEKQAETAPADET